jgi:hypothetical protein
MKSSRGSSLSSSTSSSTSKSLSSSSCTATMMINVLLIVIIILLVILLYRKINKKEKFTRFKLFGSQPITGYWYWTWDGPGSGNPPTVCDIGILFGGEVPITAINNNINSISKLTAKEKYLNLGGGDRPSGMWMQSDFAYINSQLANIKSKGWTGISFDIEVCDGTGSYIEPFADCFAKCKANGLKVLVTMSHLIPWDCKAPVRGQGASLVNSWINDSNIDYISPQLYSIDDALEPIDLSILKNAKAKIIPSVPLEADWDKIQNLGITPAGYIAWKRTGKAAVQGGCGSSWSDALARCPNNTKCFKNGDCPSGLQCFAGVKCNFCGKDYSDATTTCLYTERCNSLDSECPSGKKCFAGINCVKPPGAVNLCGVNYQSANCATSQRCPNGTNQECPSGQSCFGNIPC